MLNVIFGGPSTPFQSNCCTFASSYFILLDDFSHMIILFSHLFNTRWFALSRFHLVSFPVIEEITDSLFNVRLLQHANPYHVCILFSFIFHSVGCLFWPWCFFFTLAVLITYFFPLSSYDNTFHLTLLKCSLWGFFATALIFWCRHYFSSPALIC